MRMTLGKTWGKKLQGRIEEFEFEVGVFPDQDKMHRLPAEPQVITQYAGGPVQRAGKDTGPISTGQVLVENMKRLNINLLLRPFQDRNDEILRFTKAFLELVVKKNLSIKRVENLLQAIVRNPILRQEYGANKAATADAKGFDRHLIDTGQMFKAIRAKVKRV